MRKEAISNIIKKKPGIGFNEITRESKLSNGVVSHYILQLLKDGEIIKSDGARAKYFHHIISKKDRKIIMTVRSETNYKIIKFLLSRNVPSRAEEISKAIKKSRSTITVRLQILQKNKIIERIILNKTLKLRSDIGYIVIDKKYFEMIFSKYQFE